MNHAQTWIHKTHHGPYLRETTTFPLIVFSVLSHGANTQMSFCPKTPKLGVEIPEIETLVILETRFEAKL
jgi:hypothetical protein